MARKRTLEYIVAIVLLFQIGTIGNSWEAPLPTMSYGSVLPATSQEKHVSHALQVATLTASNNASADSLVFVGDVLLARNVEVLIERYGPKYPLSYVDVSTLAPHPFVVGNFEASIPLVHTPTPTGQIRFSVATSALQALDGVQFGAMSLANNHSLDFGADGFATTQAALEARDIKTFGHSNNLSTDSIEHVYVGDVRVAIIGINALGSLHQKALTTVFTEAKRSSDFQVVYVHWGEEYALQQSTTQRNLAQQFIGLGADAIVGHHPHVTQGIEVIEGVPVIYSLGNFLFDQYFSRDVQEGLMVAFSFDGGLRITLEPYTSQHSLSQPQPMSVEQRFTFLHSLTTRSTPDIAQMIMAGEIHFGDAIATSSKMAIINK